MQNNLISQASDMNTGSTPNDVLPGMNQVACILISPFVEYVLNPMLAKRRIYLQAVTRIAIGFCFVTLSMLHATLVQHYIYMSPPCFDHPTDCGDRHSVAQDRPNVWIQAPLYFLIATGEVFAMTTAMEYAEKHAPKEMKVLVQAINMLITGIGSAIALVIAEGARDPYLTRFYGSLTGAMAFTTVVFYVVFRNNDRDDVAASMNIVADVEKGNGEAKPTPQLTNSAHGSRESHLSTPTESSREDKEIELTAISLSQSTRVTQRNTTAVP
jgi:POT family proton-dependent oligopeptide transporter